MATQGKRRFAAILILAGIATFWQAGCTRVEYTGKHFTPSNQVTLCAKVMDDTTGTPAPYTAVQFHAETLWGGNPLLPTGNTNVVGEVCVKPRWPADIYTVQTYAGYDGSLPVVVTAYGRTWEGVFAGGTLILDTESVAGSARPTPEREATFGIIYRTDETKGCNSARLAFLDPSNPVVPIAITAAQSFSIEQNQDVRFSGPCTLQEDISILPSCRFEAVLSSGDGWKHSNLSIRVVQYPDTLLYEASGMIFEGGVVIK